MGSPYKVSKVNKEKANKIARKWMNRTQKGMRIDDFIAQEVAGQGFTGIKNKGGLNATTNNDQIQAG